MKYSILGYKQEEVIKHNLDIADLVLLRWIVDITASPKAKRKEVEGNYLVWVNYKSLLEDLPILNIKKRALQDRLSKLVEKGFLSHYHDTEKGSFSYYGITLLYESLIYDYADECRGVCSELHRGVQSNADQRLNNIENNNKKEKSINRKEMTLPFDSPRLRELWCELMDYEEWQKKSNHAIELRIKKLERVANGDVKVAIASIKQTLDKVWEDFYPPKSEEYFDKEVTQIKKRPIWEELGMTKEQYLKITNQ